MKKFLLFSFLFLFFAGSAFAADVVENTKSALQKELDIINGPYHVSVKDVSLISLTAWDTRHFDGYAVVEISDHDFLLVIKVSTDGNNTIVSFDDDVIRKDVALAHSKPHGR